MSEVDLTRYKPIVVPKLKKKKRIGITQLEFEISHQPSKIDNNDLSDDSKFGDTIVVTHKGFKRTPKNSYIELIFGIVFMIIGVYFLLTGEGSSKSYIISSCFILPSTLMIVLAFTRPSQDFVLDRVNGIIKYPNSWWYSPIVTYFVDLRAVLLYEGKVPNPTLKALSKGFLSTPYRIVNFHPLNFWSFMVWYMDKNRPLPPGTAFDAYREKDFARRRQEGFPAPLYRSAILTPEATIVQQKERERYWKEEDHMCPQFKIEEGAVLFDKNIYTEWIPFQYSDISEDNISCNTWHRYNLTKGDMVYMRTNNLGKGYRPPLNTQYEVTIVTT